MLVEIFFCIYSVFPVFHCGYYSISMVEICLNIQQNGGVTICYMCWIGAFLNPFGSFCLSEGWYSNQNMCDENNFQKVVFCEVFFL